MCGEGHGAHLDLPHGLEHPRQDTAQPAGAQQAIGVLVDDPEGNRQVVGDCLARCLDRRVSRAQVDIALVDSLVADHGGAAAASWA